MPQSIERVKKWTEANEWLVIENQRLLNLQNFFEAEQERYNQALELLTMLKEEQEQKEGEILSREQLELEFVQKREKLCDEFQARADKMDREYGTQGFLKTKSGNRKFRRVQ